MNDTNGLIKNIATSFDKLVLLFLALANILFIPLFFLLLCIGFFSMFVFSVFGLALGEPLSSIIPFIITSVLFPGIINLIMFLSNISFSVNDFSIIFNKNMIKYRLIFIIIPLVFFMVIIYNPYLVILKREIDNIDYINWYSQLFDFILITINFLFILKNKFSVMKNTNID